MRTVVASTYTPSLDSGRARRTYGVIAALAQNGPVDLVYGAFGAPEVDPAFAAIDGLALHRVDRPAAIARGPIYLRARAAGVPSAFARGIWPGLAQRAGALAEPATEVRLVAEGPIAAAALLGPARRRPAVYCAHNLESTYRHRLTTETVSQAAMERFERLLLSTFSESWMVSPADAEAATRLAPGTSLRIVPNVVDVAAIEPVPPRSGERALVFVADLSYEPNRQALNFLAEAVMARIWSQAADVRLVVAGRGSDTFGLPADPRIDARGFVADVGSIYAEAGCVVVPLLEGGGSPLKFVEALAYGVPIVATPRAAAGLEVAAGRDYLEAEPAAAPFGDAIVAALDPVRGNQLGASGRRLAERQYSIEALAKLVAP